MFLLFAPAFALSVDTVTAFEAGEGYYVNSVAVADGGTACFAAYGSDGSSQVYTWDGSAASPLETDSTYVYCTDIDDAGWLLTTDYVYTDGRYTYGGSVYDLLSGDRAQLDTSFGTYTYGYKVNGAGEVAGYSYTDTGARGATWDHTGAGGLIDTPWGYESALDIDDAGRVLLTSQQGRLYSAAIYDTVRGTRTELFASNQSLGFFEDNSLILRQGRSFYHYDVGTGDWDSLALGMTSSVYAGLNNHAGQVVVYAYGRFTSTTYCWSEESGAVPLDLGDYLGASTSSMNDAGTIVGYVYGSDYSYQPATWDCATGERTDLALPEGLTGAYGYLVAESGLVVVLGWADDYSYHLYAVDPDDGTYEEFGVEGGYTQILGFAQDAGQVFWSDAYDAERPLYVTSLSN